MEPQREDGRNDQTGPSAATAQGGSVPLPSPSALPVPSHPGPQASPQHTELPGPSAEPSAVSQDHTGTVDGRATVVFTHPAHSQATQVIWVPLRPSAQPQPAAGVGAGAGSQAAPILPAEVPNESPLPDITGSQPSLGRAADYNDGAAQQEAAGVNRKRRSCSAAPAPEPELQRARVGPSAAAAAAAAAEGNPAGCHLSGSRADPVAVGARGAPANDDSQQGGPSTEGVSVKAEPARRGGSAAAADACWGSWGVRPRRAAALAAAEAILTTLAATRRPGPPPLPAHTAEAGSGAGSATGPGNLQGRGPGRKAQPGLGGARQSSGQQQEQQSSGQTQGSGQQQSQGPEAADGYDFQPGPCITCGQPFVAKGTGLRGFFAEGTRAYSCYACCFRNYRKLGFYGPIGTRSLEEAGGRSCSRCGTTDAKDWRKDADRLGLYMCKSCKDYRTRIISLAASDAAAAEAQQGGGNAEASGPEGLPPQSLPQDQQPQQPQQPQQQVAGEICVTCGLPYVHSHGNRRGFWAEGTLAYTCGSCCLRNRKATGFYGPIGTRSLEEAGGRSCARCGDKKTYKWCNHPTQLGRYLCQTCWGHFLNLRARGREDSFVEKQQQGQQGQGNEQEPSVPRCITCDSKYVRHRFGLYGFFADGTRAFTCHSCCSRNNMRNGFYGPTGTRSMEEAGGRSCAVCKGRKTSAWHLNDEDLGTFKCSSCHLKAKAAAARVKKEEQQRQQQDGAAAAAEGKQERQSKAPECGKGLLPKRQQQQQQQQQKPQQVPQGAPRGRQRAGRASGEVAAGPGLEPGLPGQPGPSRSRGSGVQRQGAAGTTGAEGERLAAVALGAEDDKDMEERQVEEQRQEEEVVMEERQVEEQRQEDEVVMEEQRREESWTCPEGTNPGLISGWVRQLEGKVVAACESLLGLQEEGAGSGGGRAGRSSSSYGSSGVGAPPSEPRAEVLRLVGRTNRWLQSHAWCFPLSLLVGRLAANMGLDMEGPDPELDQEEQAEWEELRAHHCATFSAAADRVLGTEGGREDEGGTAPGAEDLPARRFRAVVAWLAGRLEAHLRNSSEGGGHGAVDMETEGADQGARGSALLDMLEQHLAQQQQQQQQQAPGQGEAQGQSHRLSLLEGAVGEALRLALRLGAASGVSTGGRLVLRLGPGAGGASGGGGGQGQAGGTLDTASGEGCVTVVVVAPGVLCRSSMSGSESGSGSGSGSGPGSMRDTQGLKPVLPARMVIC